MKQKGLHLVMGQYDLMAHQFAGLRGGFLMGQYVVLALYFLLALYQMNALDHMMGLHLLLGLYQVRGHH
jgi:hypothetical protein